MTFQEITELIKALSKSRLAEFKMKDGDFELSVKTDRYVDTKVHSSKMISTPISLTGSPLAAPAIQPIAAEPAPVSPEKAPSLAPAKEEASTANYLEIKSPMVGTFYRAASPEKPAYAEVGKTINKGDVVCVIEAMKLFNEIEAEISGKIVKVLVDNAKPVEYDQVLFLVEPE